MFEFTDMLDDEQRFPNERVDTIDSETGMPLVGGFGISCAAIEQGQA